MNEITKEYLNSLQSFDTEEGYRSSPSINYSTLKEIANGPKCLVAERMELTSDAIVVGNYVDSWFTNPEMVNELYEIAKPKIELSDSLEILYNSFAEEKNYNPEMSECIARCRELKLWNSIVNDEKLATRITDDFFRKLKDQESDTGKIKLTADQLAKATNAINNIMQNGPASELISENDRVLMMHQFKWEYEIGPLDSGRSMKVRVMYDMLKFDIENQRIIGIDLKTGSRPSHMFTDAFFDFRYDIQGLLYYIGIMALRKKYFPEWTRCSPEDFKFLYSPKIVNSMPIIVSLDDDFMNQYSQKFSYKGKDYKGLQELLNDADWYIANQEFENHRMLVENNCKINISKLL